MRPLGWLHYFIGGFKSVTPFSTKHMLLLAQDVFLSDVKILREIFYVLLTYTLGTDLKPFGG